MLVEKRAQFEDKLNIPENERLQSGGWVQKFLRMWVWLRNSRGKSLGHNILIRYNLKEIWQHGEATSVNLAAVKAERLRVAKRLEEFPLINHLNIDEAGLFGQ
jgi:hypothetical protein